MFEEIDEFSMKNVVIRLHRIEQNLSFFNEAFKNLHNTFVSMSKKDTSDIHMQALKKEVIELQEERKELCRVLDEFKSDKLLATLAFMAKKLQEIEHDLSDMKSEGVKKKIHLDLTMDGYEMVKKQPENTSYGPEECLKELLNSLNSKEAEALTHKFGLNGCKEKTSKEASKEMGISPARVAQLVLKGLRKCRLSVRRSLVNRLTHTKLRIAILGK